ncbi:uncharacterized protein LOC128195815 [Vigna angularis]|uniref:uncharacterized protein LOC128195815 n=1 Tax=Phaseolus angularis TaxID=3914 RepID=UPI0022B337A0|nr:uncharacterized protein LOC128195815 [Vigna angularis]
MWLLDCFEREDVACWMVQLLHVPSLFFPWTFPLDIAAAMPFTETAHNLALLFEHLLNCSEDKKPSFEVQQLHTPIQPNKFDCGVIVLKIMELWDGIDKYERNTMPSYTTEELQQFREQYVCQWILDVDNMRRNQVLEDLGIL